MHHSGIQNSQGNARGKAKKMISVKGKINAFYFFRLKKTDRIHCIPDVEVDSRNTNCVLG